MRNYFKFIFLLLIITTTSSCRKKVAFNNNFEDIIKEYKSYFSSEPFNFFSNEFYNQGSFFRVTNPSALYANDYSGLYFKKVLNRKDFNLMSSNLENRTIFMGNANDSIKYFVPNFKKTSPKGKFPIPNLNDPIHTIKDSLDMKNSKILIFKNEQGKFFNKKGIKDVKEFANLDPSFVIGKGYSNGAIVDYSNRKIIYWVLIW